jgi:hypothetical protein
MALRQQGSPNPDRLSPLPARVSPNVTLERKFSPVPFRPASPRSVSPQQAPERKMTPPSGPPKPEVKAVPAAYIKQYNSPVGLYSTENAAEGGAPPANTTVIQVER